MLALERSWLPVICVCIVSILSTYAKRPQKLDTMEIMKACGVGCKKYTVMTEDGYFLNLLRIRKKSYQSSKSKPPVLLQHGLLGSSDNWVMLGPQKDLAFILNDEGYDVWLANVRGGNYCRRHKNLSDDNPKFWNYSWHEMGYYDIPAMIDLILNVTGHQKLYYIGHSMGTTVFYVMASTRPEYNNKIRAMFSLAPVVFQSNSAEIYKTLSRHRHEIMDTFTKQKIYEVLPRRLNQFADVCQDVSLLHPVCVEMFNFFIGYGDKFNKSLLPAIVQHISSTTAKTLMHFAQNIYSGRFQQYDYGKFQNLRVYNTIDAPDYNLSLVTAPVSLHYSRTDPLSNEIDVGNLASQLPNLIGIFLVPNTFFNHLDYLWGTNVKDVLYKDIIRLMKQT